MKASTNKKQKSNKKLLFLLLLLLTIGIGLGYAVLSERLVIENTINYGAMDWDVGFTETQDAGGSIASNPVLSSDKKKINITCNLGKSTSSETCIATVVFSNNSTFDVKLSADPSITSNSTYIESITVQDTTASNANLVKDYVIASRETHTIKIVITTKELTKDILPETGLSLPITISMNWVENQ